MSPRSVISSSLLTRATARQSSLLLRPLAACMSTSTATVTTVTRSPLSFPLKPFSPSSAVPSSCLFHRSIRPLSTQIRTAIESAISSAPVVLFMKGTPETPQCGFSRATIQILGLQGVDPAKFHAFNVLDDPELREGIKEFSDWPTIPQLYVDGEFIGGCDIVVSMHQKGELAKLFEEKGVLVLEEDEQGEEVPGVRVDVNMDEGKERNGEKKE